MRILRRILTTSTKPPPRPPAGVGAWSASDRLVLRTVQRGGGWTVLLLVASLTLAAALTAFPAVLGRAVDAVLGARAP